ncbi:MAG: VWA domain-containing protein [Clostridia bacterium]|jgi:uncharacterized protein YegL|nr:VWA domain-containing protein [Clostridia bacterium]
MPGTDSVIVKKVLPLIYVIDTSGSMDGDRISSVNRAMRELEPILREKVAEIPEAEIKIGAITFSNGAKWLTPQGLVSVEHFYWNDAKAGGLTDLGAALKELNAKLSRSSFLVSETGFCAPVLIFMSDGEPNDNWEKELKNISQSNRWFQIARKIAIAIGDEANKKVLEEIVRDKEAVIQTSDLETLKNMIIAVSVSASMMAGSSRMAGDEASGASILRNATANLDDDKIVFESADEQPVFDAPDPIPVTLNDTGAGDTGWEELDEEWS